MAELTTPGPAGANDDIREVVREKYAAAALAATDADDASCGCGPGVFGSALYDEAHARRRRSRRSRPRSGAASRPRWPICTRARRCSTWARAPARTCSSAPGGSVRRAGPSAWT